MRRRTGPVHIAAAMLLLAACGGSGGGGDTGNDAPGPPPSGSSPTPPVGNALPGPRPVVGPTSFALFESGQVRPLALSADGQQLFAVNTPDNRLEILSVGDSLSPLESIRVGLDPVAVAEAPDGRVWVVNHLSDSVSIIDVSTTPARVVQTLWVGDEPRDIVFAGEDRSRAFITTAHRGQNSPVDPAFNAAVGRADVWVFDSTNIDDQAGGQHEQIVTLFGDRPRPLAVSPDGLRVYAGIFLSGNRTTSIAPDNFDRGEPSTSIDGVAAPDAGLILRYNGNSWSDGRGQIFDAWVPFTLPDYDVFEIDAITLDQRREFTGIGTILFNFAVNPVSGALYVSNHDLRNRIRFAGVASRAATTVRGHVSDTRITVITAGGEVEPRTLNKHLDFLAELPDPVGREISLSTPLGMAVSSDGNTLYLAAFGSGVVAIYPTAALEDDSFDPASIDQVPLTGGGPSGIVLDEMRGRAYVMTRFDNGLSIVDLASRTETAHIQLFNPEPESVTAGRPFLYDARLTSGNGNDSCATCHVFGDTDGLAWDLGEPDETTQPIPNTFIRISPAATPARFHPLKGPMTTQSMRGLAGHGPMHWRGDRTGSEREPGETLEEAAFKEFNAAFDAFAGLGATLDQDQMQAFTDFALQIRYPPNPVRSLDNQLQGIELRGEEQFREGVVRIQTGVREVCRDCHVLSPAAGLFGTRGLMADNSQAGERNFKIPHFRDQYQKIGMFGWGFNSPTFTGPQIRGFSFNHNGATSSNFIIADLGMPRDDLLALRAFLYAFPTESPPVTGQQVTLMSGNLGSAAARVDLLVARALVTEPVPECDLVASGVIGNESRGWLMREDGLFHGDRRGSAGISRSDLEALLSGDSDRITLMCVPWGSGERIGFDRDLDGQLDRD